MVNDDDDEVRFTLRLPVDLRNRIHRQATERGRSLNAEIVHRLEASKIDADRAQVDVETLRDKFAMAALGFGFDWTNVHETGGYDEAATVAYAIADAMLKAREASND